MTKQFNLKSRPTKNGKEPLIIKSRKESTPSLKMARELRLRTSFEMSNIKYIRIYTELLSQLRDKSNVDIYITNDRKENFTIENCIKCVFKTYDDLIKHHGLEYGSKLWKEFRNYTLRQSRGQSLSKISYATATGKVDRVISKFDILRPLIFASKGGCSNAYQILNSLFYSTRLDTRLPCKKYSIDCVTGETYLSSNALEIYDKWIKEKFENGSYQRPNIDAVRTASNLGELPIAVASPTGDSNLDSLQVQALSLRESKLWNPFKNLADHLNDSLLVSYLDSLTIELKKLGKTKIGPLRRITRVSDSDIKNRIIAIVDTYSQLLGGKVQKLLYWSLTRNHIKHTDVFDHSKGKFRIVKPDCETIFTNPGEPYILKCLDATDWTWQFRKEPQLSYLEACVGKGISDPFKPLFIDCVWSTDKALTGYESVIAESGQAMGTKSSFVLATVTSISIIEAACEGVFDDFLSPEDQMALKEIGKFKQPCHKQFCETGDDTLIYDYYNRIEVALTLFGVSFNQWKSVSSTEFPSGNITLFTEYLSRTALNYRDTSRISLRLCRLAEKHYTYAPHLLSHLHERLDGDCLNINWDQIWSKDGEPILDRYGRKWSDNLKLILTLENPTKLPKEFLEDHNLLATLDDEYIVKYPLYKCLHLLGNLTKKIEKHVAILGKNWDNFFELRLAQVEDEMPITSSSGQLLVPQVYMWNEKLKKVSTLVNNLVNFTYTIIDCPSEEEIIPLPEESTVSYMKRTILIRTSIGNLTKLVKSINPEDKESLNQIEQLIVDEVDLIDGEYPKYKDRTLHYKNISSLCIRTYNDEIAKGLYESDPDCPPDGQTEV